MLGGWEARKLGGKGQISDIGDQRSEGEGMNIEHRTPNIE